MSNILTSAMRAFLEAPRFAVLGTINPDGSPHLTVLWYELQGDELMLNTATKRKKALNLEHDPRVAVIIEDGYRYLTVYGTAALVHEPDVAHEDIRRLAVRYQGEAEGQRMYNEEYAQEERVSIRVTLNHVDQFGFDEE